MYLFGPALRMCGDRPSADVILKQLSSLEAPANCIAGIDTLRLRFGTLLYTRVVILQHLAFLLEHFQKTLITVYFLLQGFLRPMIQGMGSEEELMWIADKNAVSSTQNDSQMLISAAQYW